MGNGVFPSTDKGNFQVHRARSKWKFQLKDGIMHIDNKDYCFQKCSGEAEW